MHTFNSDFFNTKFRQITEEITNLVILDDNDITWKEEFYADFKQEDESMPSSNELSSKTVTYRRDQITGGKIFWYYTDKVWGVSISCKGTYEDMQPCFKKEEDAETFFKRVLEWAFKKQ